MTTTYPTYEEAAQAYWATFAAFLERPQQIETAVRRGAGDIPAEVLIDRADDIADISAQLVALARDRLESGSQAEREGLSVHLLAQAATELRVATELLEIAADDRRPQQTLPTTRSSRGIMLRDTISRLDVTMQTPIANGITSALPTSRATQAITPQAAQQTLRQTAEQATTAIVRRVIELGGDIVYNLIMETEWKLVLDSIGLLGEEITEKLDQIKTGAIALIRRAVAAAQKLLLHVYDKILTLLGKDVEDTARKKVQEWLDQMAKDKKVNLFDTLVSALYQTEAFKKDLGGWLGTTTAPLATLNQTTDAVRAVSGKFITLAGYASTLSTALIYARGLGTWFPLVLPIVVGLQVSLLATVTYTGYDFIGYKQISFVNITEGVAEVITRNLGIMH